MFGFDVSVGLISVLGLVLLVVLTGLIIASRYRVAGPNEAFIVTGRKGKARCTTPRPGEISTDLSGQKVVMGGGAFVIPFVQRLGTSTCRAVASRSRSGAPSPGRASSSTSTASRSSRSAATRTRSGPPHSASSPSRRRSRPSPRRCSPAALRSIVGSLTVEQIIRDRAAFAQRVADESESSLTGQGLVLDTFQIQDITDDGTYLADLGRPEAASVGQVAAIAEANARQAAEQARIVAEQEIAITQRAARAEAVRDQGRDRRGLRPGRRRRPARAGRPRPGDPHRAGEGRRPAGRAQGAPARHRGPQAGRCRPLPGRAGGRGRPQRRDPRGRRPQGRHHRGRRGGRREGPAHR